MMDTEIDNTPAEHQGDFDSRYTVFDRLKYPVCIIATDGLLSYCNEAFKALYGSGTGELRLYLEHPLYPEYRKRLAQAYLGALGGNDRQCFSVIESGDGRQLPVEIYLFPMFEAGGEVDAIMALLRVVDDRLLSFDRSTLQHLSEENFQYDDQHFQFSPVPSFRINENMQITKCSQSFEGFMGLKAEEILKNEKLSFSSIFIYDADRIKKSATDIFSGKIPFTRKGEVKIAAHESEEKIVNITLYPIIEESKISSVEIVMEDITEIKSLKEKINSINRIKLLADITKGFLHSLNNSINIIMSQTQMLLQITEKETVLEGIRDIETAATDIVDNIRRVQNSIAEKSYRYGERTEPLVNVIEDAIEFSRMQFKVEDKEKRRNIKIEKKYFSPANIKIDTGLLREIIISIILKVSAYIKKKGTINLTLKENSDISLTVHVHKDDSVMDTLHLPKMINVFSGIDIRQAAEKINLKIFEEESSEEYIIKAIFPQRSIIDKEQKEAPSIEVKVRDLDIIVVEDEKALQKILFELFDRMGNRVFICENGNDALEEFKSKHYDLVISDYGIPGITGIELAARIREIDEDVPIMLLSGWTIDDLDAYKNVVDIFMPKPFKLEDLLKNISQLMKRKQKKIK